MAEGGGLIAAVSNMVRYIPTTPKLLAYGVSMCYIYDSIKI